MEDIDKDKNEPTPELLCLPFHRIAGHTSGTNRNEKFHFGVQVKDKQRNSFGELRDGQQHLMAKYGEFTECVRQQKVWWEKESNQDRARDSAINKVLQYVIDTVNKYTLGDTDSIYQVECFYTNLKELYFSFFTDHYQKLVFTLNLGFLLWKLIHFGF